MTHNWLIVATIVVPIASLALAAASAFVALRKSRQLREEQTALKMYIRRREFEGYKRGSDPHAGPDRRLSSEMTDALGEQVKSVEKLSELGGDE